MHASLAAASLSMRRGDIAGVGSRKEGKALMVSDSQQAPDPGLAALVMMLQSQGVAADAVQIRHRLSTPAIGVPDMLRCAKDYGLKASTFTTRWSRLARIPMPASPF